jgi:YD repeat-containing protein
MPMMHGIDRKISTKDALGQTRSVSYDLVGNVLTQTDELGRVTSYAYDLVNRLLTDTNQLGKTRTRSYDNVGNLTQTVDRDGRSISYSYDTLNRQTAEKWLDASNAKIKTFGSSYDAVGHLVSSTNPDSSYSYGYDAVDRVTSNDIAAEIARCQQDLNNLAEAQQELNCSAQARFEGEQAKYNKKWRHEMPTASKLERTPRDECLFPPLLTIGEREQSNFTDPQSRIVKNPGNKGFDHQTLLIVANTFSNRPNDQLDALPTVDKIDRRVGKVKRAALDTGYFSANNIEGLQARQIDPFIATGRQPRRIYWQTLLAQLPDPPAANAPLTSKMAISCKLTRAKLSIACVSVLLNPLLALSKRRWDFASSL